ncbi:MAG: GntR family transcriptional regulator [Alphaproteobacteria bacterium]|nr:GntR family transcriptional regulator [Alphaproteobacteria bacterium]
MVEQIAHELAYDILFRRIKPGTRLREADLVERFGVSRPAIREVLTSLTKLGCVENTPWKGATVIRVTREELEVLYDFRGYVFAFVTRLAMRHIDRDDLAAFRSAVAALDRAAKGGATAEEYEMLRNTTHQILTEIASRHYPVVHRIVPSTRLSCQYAIEAVRTRTQRQTSAKRWQKLLGIMETGDAEAASAYALEMNESSRVVVLAAFDELSESER